MAVEWGGVRTVGVVAEHGGAVAVRRELLLAETHAGRRHQHRPAMPAVPQRGRAATIALPQQRFWWAWGSSAPLQLRLNFLEGEGAQLGAGGIGHVARAGRYGQEARAGERQRHHPPTQRSARPGAQCHNEGQSLGNCAGERARGSGEQKKKPRTKSERERGLVAHVVPAATPAATSAAATPAAATASPVVVAAATSATPATATAVATTTTAPTPPTAATAARRGRVGDVDAHPAPIEHLPVHLIRRQLHATTHTLTPDTFATFKRRGRTCATSASSKVTKPKPRERIGLSRSMITAASVTVPNSSNACATQTTVPHLSRSDLKGEVLGCVCAPLAA